MRTKQKRVVGLVVPNPKKTPDVIGRYIRRQMQTKVNKVIFLFDSVSYSEFKRHFGGKISLEGLKRFNSNFPTGTYTAYPSIFFGVKTGRHGLVGTAYYSSKEDGLFSLMSDRVTDLDGNKITDRRYKRDRSLHSFLEYSKSRPIFLSQDLGWLKTSLWDVILLNSQRITIPLKGPEDKRDYDYELRALIKKAASMVEKKKPGLLCVFVDFDEPMHIFGVKSAKTQRLLKMCSSLIADMVKSNPNYDYFFVSDHGQIDQKNTKKLSVEHVKDKLYCSNGGVGRARYIYSKSEAVFEDIKRQVGASGLVLKRSDPRLKRLFGFSPAKVDSIGNIIAVATSASFPSHGWNWKAEHGGLSPEEIFIPFLHLKAKVRKS
ncbi:MAG: alkaline phosphatase family protein [Candidatus Micrarchaeota archaeon]|nr:alkaline phosphatase family protein [Candidatus Micrarchaeota archaeon]